MEKETSTSSSVHPGEAAWDFNAWANLALPDMPVHHHGPGNCMDWDDLDITDQGSVEPSFQRPTLETFEVGASTVPIPAQPAVDATMVVQAEQIVTNNASAPQDVTIMNTRLGHRNRRRLQHKRRTGTASMPLTASMQTPQPSQTTLSARTVSHDADPLHGQRGHVQWNEPPSEQANRANRATVVVLALIFLGLALTGHLPF